MAVPQPPPRPPMPALAAFLSYLVPGLGQICQGRVAKGILFLVCIYALFFYGMHLGHWSNVYLPDVVEPGMTPPVPRPLWNCYNRLQFGGQVWIGVAAWPALLQYAQYNPRDNGPAFLHGFQRSPDERTLNKFQIEGDKTWDLGWVFTVIAGVLNVLVMYDAFAGPAFGDNDSKPKSPEEAAS